MNFDLETAIPVRKNEDGLLEQDSFNVSTAKPISQQESDFVIKNWDNPRFMPQMSDEEKARATVELSYRDAGKEVPLATRIGWTLTSDEVLAPAKAALLTYFTGGWYIPYAMLQESLDDEGKKYSIVDRLKRGLLYPEEVKPLHRNIPGAENLPPWADITANIATNVLFYSATGYLTGALKRELFIKDLNREIEKGAQSFSDDIISTQKGGVATEEGATVINNNVDQLKNLYKQKAIQNLEALATKEVSPGVFESSGKTTVEEIYQRKNLLNLVINDLKNLNKSGEIRIPKIGEQVSFMAKNGVTKIGTVREIVGERIHIDMDGKKVIAVLGQLTSNIPNLINTEGKMIMYRGTVGIGEIENIQAGKVRYDDDYGGMWTEDIKSAENYGKGMSIAQGSSTLKPRGEGNYIIEGIKDTNGTITPTKATNIKTGEVIQFSTPTGEGKVIPIKTKIIDNVNFADVESKSNIDKSMQILNASSNLEANDLYKTEDVDFNKAKEIGQEYYYGNLYGTSIASPAFNNEKVLFDDNGWNHITEIGKRPGLTETNVIRRIKLIPKAVEVLKNIGVVESERSNPVDGKTYGIIGKFKDGEVVRIIVQQIEKAGKRFFSVFNVEDLSKKIGKETTQVASPSLSSGQGSHGVGEEPPTLTNKNITQEGEVVKGNLPPPPHSRGGLVPPEMEFGNWKDKSTFSLSREILERNIEDVAGKDAEKVKAFITEPIKKNETARVEWLNENRQAISGKMKELNIKFKSEDSKLVMRYGEDRMTLDELKSASPKNWENISKASEYFRNLYDEMLDKINLVRSEFGYDPIPKRQDYFRHYQQMGNVIQSMGLIFREQDLPTGISGLTGIFKPGKPFTTTELQRKGGPFTEDAIGAMDNYLDAISKQIFHTDSVQRARVIEKYIRTQSEVNEKVKLPNLVANLNEYANLIAGKKATVDRAFEGLLGRPLYRIMSYLKKQTIANMIGSNVSSALMNFIPFTQSLSTTKPQAAIKGLLESLMTPFNQTHFEIDGVKSDLFTRRYPENAMAMDWFDRTKEGANTLFRLVDQFCAKAILSGKYYEGIDAGLTPKDAMLQADNYTSRVLADRSWGQLPNLMGSKTLGVFTQFQTEINNMFSNILKDIPRQYEGDAKKIFGALATFAILSFLFNEAYERTLGRRPTIDPIYAVLTLMGMSSLGKDQPVGKRIWKTIVDVGGNLPFGNLVVQGGRFPISAGIPDLNKILTAETTSAKAKELMKPIYYFALPMAGGQVKETIEGTLDFVKGESTTPTGRTRYTIEQNFSNFLRGFLFGKNAFPESRKHYEDSGKDEGLSSGSRLKLGNGLKSGSKLKR